MKMKNLATGSLFALIASAAAGCIIQDNTGYEDATITAKWSFLNLANETVTGCPIGFNTVRLVSQPIDRDFQAVGEPFIDLFDCVDGRHPSALLPPDIYQVWVEVTNNRETELYAQSTSTIIDVIERDATFEATILNDGGYFLFDWALLGETSNARLSCGEAGTGTVSILTTLNGTTEGHDELFECGSGSGLTSGRLNGSYTISVAALDANDRSIGTAPALTNKAILDRNRVTDLGVVTIPIDNQ
jgi:hypothetical protein